MPGTFITMSAIIINHWGCYCSLVSPVSVYKLGQCYKLSWLCMRKRSFRVNTCIMLTLTSVGAWTHCARTLESQIRDSIPLLPCWTRSF